MKINVLILVTVLMTAFLSPARGEPAGDEQVKKEWMTFYRKYFNLDLNLSHLSIPPHQTGYDRVIVVAGGLTFESLILVMRQHFEVLFANTYLPGYFDHNIISSRTNEQTYAIRVKDNHEAGETYRTSVGIEKLFSDAPEGRPVNEINLKERLLLELKYNDESGDHLDQETFTVCTGSYYRKDSLALSPAVGWKAGNGSYYPPFLFISECYAVYTLDGLYSRSVVAY